MFTNLEDLKKSVSIENIISSFIKLKKTTSGGVGLCPLHNEKTPSFNVNYKKNTFKCFGCGKSGDAIDFISLHNNVGFLDAVRTVAKLSNFNLEDDNREVVKPIPRLEKLSSKFLKNFEEVRKISNNTLLRFGVTEATEWMPKAQKEIHVICFNYIRNNEVVNIKFRGANKDMKLAKDAELIFYNLDAIQNKTDCVIVEGEIDCLSMYEADIHNCVSVPNGANSNMRYIDNCYEYFLKKTKIILALDNDAPGLKLRDELICRFGNDRCYIVEFPVDCKDANDVLVKHGKKCLSKLIDDAIPIPIEGLTDSKERTTRLLDLYDNGVPKGTPSGIMGLDDYIRFQTGLVTTITGSPSSGKSEFLDNICANLAIRENWKFGIFSFENQPTELHDAKLAEKIAGKSFSYRKDGSNRIDKETLKLVMNELCDKFKIIDKSKVDITLDGILAKAEELVYKFGIKGVVIDPYNKILHNITGGMTETNYINNFMTRITAFAQKFNVHIFLVAHPAKPSKGNLGKSEKPTLYSISGSANFYNQTDNGIVIHRDRESKIVDVDIQKIRFSEQGQEGFVSFTFDTMTRQYYYHASSYPVATSYTPTLAGSIVKDIKLEGNWKQLPPEKEDNIF